jgi:predicted ATP-dependent endonuclease of OLD family
MQLLSLYIKKYKNLEEFKWEITSEFASPALMIMGKNASGKTNLLEAILKIFDFLYNSETRRADFYFEIEYIIEIVKIKIICEKNTHIDGVYIDDKFVAIGDIVRMNNTFKPRSKDYNLENILPENVVLYYSGFSQRFLPISNQIKNLYSKKFRKQKEITLPPILCLDPFHYKIILLSLFCYEKETSQIYEDFLKKYFNIESLHSFEIHIKKHTGWVEDREYKDFFSTKGIVRNFLNQLDEFQKVSSNNLPPVYPLPQLINSSQNLSLVNRVEYKFEGSDTLLELKNLFGYESDMFKILNILYITGNLSNIIIKVNKTGNEEPISFRDLSEGEQQFLAIQGMNYLLQGKDTLFLWDEPDTFLNPSWQWNLIPNIENEYKLGDIQRDQFILTSHSPVLLSTVSKRAYFMENGKINNLPNVFGRTVNDVLNEQGIESQNKEIIEEINDLFDIIEDREIEKAIKMIDKLELSFGKNHPDLIKANYLVKLYNQ